MTVLEKIKAEIIDHFTWGNKEEELEEVQNYAAQKCIDIINKYIEQEDKDVVQFSIDLEKYDGISEDSIRDILEKNGLAVRGIMWKASWKAEDYDNGEQPYSYD